MNKKIKIIVSIILVCVTIITATLIATSIATVNYAMPFNKPNQIIVYLDSKDNCVVFEPSDNEYELIYNSIIKAYKQSVLQAFVNNGLDKDVKVNTNRNTTVKFNGIKINFVYYNPQPVKTKQGVYSLNGKDCWYQYLIFDIVEGDKYQYNIVAIVPPTTSADFVGPFNYSLHYMVYSNFDNTSALINNLCK